MANNRGDSLTNANLDSLLPSSQHQPLDETENLGNVTSASASTNADIPQSIGRYQIAGLLGEGSYGRVFKAFDTKLQRNVAIKVPHLYRITSDTSLDRYLEEARTLAKLEHPAVVAVHDVGATENGLPFIVSNLVDGTSLAQRMRDSPLAMGDGIRLLVVVGRALAYVHAKGVVHRDIKPGNILLNSEGKPFVADFGLALRDELPEADRQHVGTPSYMSPEQARGEAHLVDGRSDIFSLGVVLFQMLTGKLPFAGDSRKTVIRQLLEKEAPPPRQLNDAVPRELDRICLKAMAKRSSDRYSTAVDFVNDLEHFLTHFNTGESNTVGDSSIASSMSSASYPTVVPRGLRSFDRHDAGFFCRLLPGPHDRDWVPESLLFWKRKLENAEPDEAFRVGVIYGPSGCGKSSFVKAGLIPLLRDSMLPVFVEATRDDTETRLLRGVRKRCPGLSAGSGLVQSLAEVRRGGRGVLIVIDQFEQWLHGRVDQDESDLAMALRQCDGVHLQCLLLLRDDFWLAMSRFASILEVPLKQNQNVTLVDLFSLPHARRVLAEFGVAYDRIPANWQQRTPGQNQFLSRAVEELSEDGKIVPVHLSLFVEMVKSQSWELATLSQLGGVEGIGTRFLEESFSGPHAPASQRIHEAAVRNVLRQLLPDQGGDLKGTMRAEQELLVASGYQNQSAAFDDLMQILDNELRLITPTDPIGSTISSDSFTVSGDGSRYYQLTHDFLVPALYQWLNKKQRETRRGRAELRLAEYANLWSSKPIAKFAPSWLEWLSIRIHSSPRTWSQTERRMMRLAGRRHLVHTLIAVAAVLMLSFGALALQRRSRVASAIRQLQTAQTSQLDGILDTLGNDQAFAPNAIRSELARSEPGSRKELIHRLALLPHDPSQKDALADRLLSEPLPMVLVLRRELQPMSAELTDGLIERLKDSEQSDESRLRAAIALALYLPPVSTPESASSGEGDDAEVDQSAANAIWSDHAELIVETMLHHAVTTPQDYNVLVSSLEGAKEVLVPWLAVRGLETQQTPERMSATGVLIHYLRDDPARLLAYALDASPDQYETFLAVLDEHLTGLSGALVRQAFSEIDSNLPEKEFDQLSHRKSMAASLLHRIGVGESSWSLLKTSEMPHARSYMIHHIPTLGGDLGFVLGRLAREPHPSIRQALVLIVGQFDWNGIPQGARIQSLNVLKDIFETDPEVGVHSAARWALRRHDESDWVDATLTKQAGLTPDPRKNWYVNGQGQTMAILDARDVPEIGRVFEIATMEVTREQFQRFRPHHAEYRPYRSPTLDCPVGTTDWYDCVAYCRWLTNEVYEDLEFAYPDGLNIDSPSQDVDDVLAHGAYRLPTSHEWLFACAALTKSSRYFGLNDSLVSEYFWHWETSTFDEQLRIRYWPADQLKPNDFGIFSTYDAVREWCHDPADRGRRRKVMGNHSGQDAVRCTTSNTSSQDLPNSVSGFYGLRVARTVTSR